MASNKKFTVQVELDGSELLKDMEKVLERMSLDITKNKSLTQSFKSVAARLAGDFTRTFNDSIKGLKVDFSFLEGATEDTLKKSESFLKITEAMTHARQAQLNVTIKQAKADEAVARALIAQSKARQQVDREAGRGTSTGSAVNEARNRKILEDQARDLLRKAEVDAKRLAAQKEADAKKEMANIFAAWRARDQADKQKLVDDRRIASEAARAAKEKEKALQTEMKLLRDLATQAEKNIQQQRAAAEKALQQSMRAEVRASRANASGSRASNTSDGPSDLTRFLSSRATQREGALGQIAAFSKTLGGGFGTAIAGAVGAVYLLQRALQGLFDLMADGTQKAIELSRSQFQLATALRASQRVYGKEAVGTIREYTNVIDELSKKFGIFSKQDLTQGLAYIINATRQFGLTKDKIAELTEATVILSQRSGASFEDVASNIVSLMLGQSRALERFGIDAGVEAFEQQAVMLGYKEAFGGLGLADKALVRLDFLLGEVESSRADAVLAQETSFGKLQKAAAQSEDSLTRMGKAFVPLQVGWSEFSANVVFGLEMWSNLIGGVFKGLYVEIKTINDQMLVLALSTIGFVGDTMNFFGLLSDEGKRRLEELKKIADEISGGNIFDLDSIRKKHGDEYDKLQSNPPLPDVDQVSGLAPSDADAEAAEKFKDWFMQQWLEVESIENDFNEGRLEAHADYWERYGEINKTYAKGIQEAVNKYYESLQDAQDEFQERSLEAWEDYQEKLADIATDNQQELEDLEREKLRKLEDISTEQDDERIKADRDLAKKLADIEQELQDKLQSIREQYAISIDEAVQKRDARAILNLQRRRAQEIGEAYRDYNRKRQDAMDSYQKAIEDARKKERERVEEIQKWYERELQDQAIKDQRKRDEALKDYQRTLADLTKNLNAQNMEILKNYRQQLIQLRSNLIEQRQELNDNYRKQLEDLKKAHDKRLQELTRQWAMENYVNESQARRSWEILSQYFNVGGYIDVLMSEFIKRAQGRVEIEVKASGIFNSAKSQSTAAPTAPKPPLSPNAPAPIFPNPNSAGVGVSYADRTPSTQHHTHTFHFTGVIPDAEVRTQVIETLTEIYKEVSK